MMLSPEDIGMKAALASSFAFGLFKLKLDFNKRLHAAVAITLILCSTALALSAIPAWAMSALGAALPFVKVLI